MPWHRQKDGRKRPTYPLPHSFVPRSWRSIMPGRPLRARATPRLLRDFPGAVASSLIPPRNSLPHRPAGCTTRPYARNAPLIRNEVINRASHLALIVLLEVHLMARKIKNTKTADQRRAEAEAMQAKI